MKKRIILPLIIGAVVCTCCGCHTNKSFTYNVETGDTVKIKLDTTGGYDLSSDLPFEISKDGETYTYGTFLTLEGYQMYYDEIHNSDVEILDEGEKGDCQYVFYNTDSEYDYLVLIEDSNTGVLLGNNISEESAEECFDRMDITLE